MIGVVTTAIAALALSLAAVIVIDRAARKERANLLDRIQAPEAAATRAWTAPDIPRIETDADIDAAYAASDEAAPVVPDDLNPMYFPKET